MKFQRLKDMVCGAVIASMVLCSGTVAFAKVANMNIPVSFSNIKIIVDGKQLSTSKEPFTYNGTTYLPVRAVAEAVGKDVTWDGATKTVYLGEKPQNTTQTTSNQTTELSAKEYYYEKYGSFYYDLLVTNNSPDALRIESNVVAKDAAGNSIGAKSDSASVVGSGETAILTHIFDSVPAKTTYTLKTEKETYFKSATADLKTTSSKAGDKVLVAATNLGNYDMEFVKATVFFFKNGKVVGSDYKYLDDNSYKLSAGGTVTEEFELFPENEFDKYEVYVEARK